MKAEINNENKSKFFALYWGQFVALDEDRGDFETLFPSLLVGMNFNCASILLKPLSQISDEDAIEIGYDSDIISEHDWFYDFQTDYLRSKGYALPWMGLSVDEMIEAGWIKLTEE